MPDALSRSPHCSRITDADSDDVFPDDLSSPNPREPAGPRGLILDGMLLTDLSPISVDEKGSSEQMSVLPAGTDETSVASTVGKEDGTDHQSQSKHPAHVTRTAAINTSVSTRRSTRQGQPSARLQSMLLNTHPRGAPRVSLTRQHGQGARRRQRSHRALSTWKRYSHRGNRHRTRR